MKSLWASYSAARGVIPHASTINPLMHPLQEKSATIQGLPVSSAEDANYHSPVTAPSSENPPRSSPGSTRSGESGLFSSPATARASTQEVGVEDGGSLPVSHLPVADALVLN